ncbi:hypothetical protein O181_100012 [Austropuccinia psidii MF-1]|uniref:Kinesin motor domain-containing protein n=1 Tax=Austropuccinia psidii MF-1 TaxID=1389203 RepID=A0A9Q3JEE2_9BASI|nr:hypothetical protein [Austropuccinia psidii MF-1]
MDSLSLSSNNNNIIHFSSISQASHHSLDLQSPKFKSSQLSPPNQIHSNHLLSTHSTNSNIDSSDQKPTSVQVILRIRPPNFDINFPSRFQHIILDTISSKTDSIETSAPSISNTQSNSNNKSTQKFTFDRVFSQQDDQLKIWLSVQGLINRFVKGYNFTVFSYCQTSSGKSYTMVTNASKLIHQSSSNQSIRSSWYHPFLNW